MEILIPSLVLFLFAVAIAFFVFPRVAPEILVGSSAAVLAIAIYMHVKQFGVMEYERATWMYRIRQYGAFFFVGLILLGGYGFYAFNDSSSSNVTSPIIGGSLNSMMRTATSRIDQLMRKGRIS